MEAMKRREIRIPDYTVNEEIFNAVSHGLGALLSTAALVLMTVKAHGTMPEVTVTLYGTAMILLYTGSCVYHALSPREKGKQVMRVVDHCNVYLLVLGTYLPVALLGIGGRTGWLLLGIVFLFTALGIIFTAIDVDRFGLVSVICHLLSGWSILFGVPGLLQTMGWGGMLWMLVGGVVYSVGAILYGLGKTRRYRHCVFHVCCLLGTFCHFWAVYIFLL